MRLLFLLVLLVPGLAVAQLRPISSTGGNGMGSTNISYSTNSGLGAPHSSIQYNSNGVMQGNASLLYTNGVIVGATGMAFNVMSGRIAFFATEPGVGGEFFDVTPSNTNDSQVDDTFAARFQLRVQDENNGHNNKNAGALSEIFTLPNNTQDYTWFNIGNYGYVHHQGSGRLSQTAAHYGISGVYGDGDILISRGGYYQSLIAAGAGSIGESIALHVVDGIDAGSGKITNAYGLYLETQTVGASNNWQIFSENGKSYFGGPILYGVSTNSANGRIQLVASISPTGGIAFGPLASEVLYRHSAATLQTDSALRIGGKTYYGDDAIPITDNAADMGSATFRFRNGNYAGRLVAGTSFRAGNIFHVTNDLVGLGLFGALSPTNLFDVKGHTSLRSNLFLANLPTNGSPIAFLATDSDGAVYETAVPAGSGSASTNVNVGHTIYLDSVFGVDATAARDNAARPYLTVTNAIAAMLDGDTLVVRAGTYLLNTKADTTSTPGGAHDTPAVGLTNRSNIRIVGEPGAIWAMDTMYSNSCPMLSLFLCTNVVVEGMTFRGIRTNAPTTHFAGVWVRHSDGVTFRANRFQNWQNQGLSDRSTTTVNRNIRVLYNEFTDCGGTNQLFGPGTPLLTDGTAVSIIASHLVVVGNRFRANLRDIEFCCEGDARGVLIADNISELCYQTSILLIATNVSEARIVNNIASGYATNSGGVAQWLEFYGGSNVVVQGNIVGGFYNGVGYLPSATAALVDIGIYDNTFTDITGSGVNIHRATAVPGLKVERIAVMRNKFQNTLAQAISLSANHARIEDNEMADCNTSQTVGGVIRIGFSSGYYTNSTNITLVGNKIYTSHLSANTSTGIVIYGLSVSNVVWGNEVRSYAATLHDLGVNTLRMPLNKILPGKLLYSDTNSRMAEVTIGSGVAFDGSTGTLTGSGGSGTPGGSTYSVQFNDAGAFAGNTNFQHHPIEWFTEFFGPTFSINDGTETNIFDPYGFGTMGDNGIQFRSWTSQVRWSIPTNGHFIPWETNRFDVGSFAKPVRTNWMDNFSARGNGVILNRLGIGTDTPLVNLHIGGASSGTIQSAILQNSGDDLFLKTVGMHAVLFGTVNTVRWVMNGAGHFLANADNTYDIGATGANRPRNLYVAGFSKVAGQVEAGGLVLPNIAAGSLLYNDSGTEVAAATLGGGHHLSAGLLSHTNLVVANTTNQIVFGATNIPPASAVAPTKWISVQVAGESTVYRLPLYQ